MNRSTAAGPARSLGRRARTYLAVFASGFVLVLLIILAVRPERTEYTPGSDEEARSAITSRLARDLPSDAPAVRFVDAAEAAGIRFHHFQGTRSTQLPEDMGSGAAWGDYDGDGDPDLFLVNESGPLVDRPGDSGSARSALYRNDGGGRFSDVTDEAGVGVGGCGMGAAWGDFDSDGDLDLLVTRFGTNVLFRNRGDGTFEDATRAAGLHGFEGFWTGASWSDYDRDGDLDLYVCGYVRYRYDADLAGRTSQQYQAVVPFTLNPSTYAPERNLLFRNDGGTFSETARAAGVDNATGRSLSAAWADFDQDGWPDLYVANDISDNALFHNRGDGTFRDISHSAWVADYRGAMGLAVGDWENDGDLDIFVTHWIAQENALFENQRGGMTTTASEPVRFMDQSDLNGLGQIALDYIGWGTEFFDYDNDGRLDLFVANGSTFQERDDPVRLVPMRHLLFWNAGPGRGFYEVGAATSEALEAADVGRGAAFADYDGDGDIDILVAVNGGRVRLLRNEGGDAGAWARIVLRGAAGAGRENAAEDGPRASPPFAEGAIVTVHTGSQRRMRLVGGSPSYLSQSPPGEVLFGLGTAGRIDRLEVHWPSGLEQSFEGLPVRTTIRIQEGEAPVAGGAEKSDRADARRFWTVFRQATQTRIGGDCAGAIRQYEEALTLDPSHEDSLYYLGQCFREVGRYERSRDALSRLIRINPAAARGHSALGSLLASPDEGAPWDPAAAETHLRRAHEINAEETGPIVRIGELLILRGEHAEAAELLEGASRTNPRSVEAAFLAGYLRWNDGDGARALEWFSRAVEAARPTRPAEGVPGEGDVRPGAVMMSRKDDTLFGAFARGLLGEERGFAGPMSDLDGVYAPVRKFARDLAARTRP